MPTQQHAPSPLTEWAGAIPDTFRGLLAWQWLPEMPLTLRHSRFLAMLYALLARADPLGTVRPRAPEPLALDVARSSGIRPEAAERYLAAALAAGVLAERLPGLYALVPSVVPDWPAAAAHLIPGLQDAQSPARPRLDTHSPTGDT